MLQSTYAKLRYISSTRSVGDFLIYGLVTRLLALLYCIAHDRYVDHIKYTDIDYYVFTNGSRALLEGKSPFISEEYRYSPLVALTFLPNILIHESFGKLILVLADIVSGHLLYTLNILQGTHRIKSKLFLILWLFNPVTIAISTRGSFEPIITLLVLATVYCLVSSHHVAAGFLYGLSIHIKLYPIIYALSIYIYMINRKPYLKIQTRVLYWVKTLSPSSNHFKFLTSSLISLISSSLIAYNYYGQEYLDQSLLYHIKRKDLQHNFSIYFYLFKLFPEDQFVGVAAFVTQIIGVIIITLTYASFDSNRRTKLKKLSFCLFSSTFLFVSLNKVCTSQYFNWYLIFLPLILDSLDLNNFQALYLVISWILTQANWLFFAYLFEYQNYDVIDYVGASSALFLMNNLSILFTLCRHFDATGKKEHALE